MKQKKSPKHSSLVLLVEDNADHMQLVSALLTERFAPLQIHAVETVDDGLELATRKPYDLIILSAFLNNRSVVQHLPSFANLVPAPPIIVLAGSGDESLAAEAIKRGATEYVVKNREALERLPTLLKKYLDPKKRKRHLGKRVSIPPQHQTDMAQRLCRAADSLTQQLRTLLRQHPNGKTRNTLQQHIQHLRAATTNARSKKKTQ